MKHWPVLIGFALVGAFSGSAAAPEGDWAARVDRLVDERRPTVNEKRFDEIGWVRSLREAETLAREHGRPVFLFTHDGHMAIGRC
jgi:hypothetical protein